MEPKIFRFFQYIELIFSNFVAYFSPLVYLQGWEILAKRSAAGAPVQPTRLSAGARSEIKETSNKGAVDQRSSRLPDPFGVRSVDQPDVGRRLLLDTSCRSVRTAFSNLFFKKENFCTKGESSSSVFAGGIFFLFVGFVSGNLFGTFLPAIRIFFSWDGFIVIFLLFFIEFISYIRYQRKNRFFLILWDFPSGSFPPLAQKPIPFTKEKFPLDLEDERRKLHRLNNEVPSVPKKGKRNDNKIAFTRNFPFFIISQAKQGPSAKETRGSESSPGGHGEKQPAPEPEGLVTTQPTYGRQSQAEGLLNRRLDPLGKDSRLTAPLFSNEGCSPFLERSPPFPAKGLLQTLWAVNTSCRPRKSFNYFKIGFLLGFFIDAYKVGS